MPWGTPWKRSWAGDTVRRRIADAILAAGSSQLFWYATLPLVTRLYPKDAIGLFGTFLSYASFVGLVIGARSDLAILTTARTSLAVTRTAFIKLSTLLLAVTAVLMMAAGLVTHMPLLSFPGSLFVLVGGAFIFRFTLEGVSLIKVGDYGSLRNTAFSRSLVQAILQLALFKFHFAGLALGRMAGDLLGAWQRRLRLRKAGHLGDPAERQHGFLPNPAEIASLRSNARAYTYSFPQTLLNSLSQALPFLFLPKVASLAWMGQYTLAFTLAVAPVGLVSTPVRQLLVASFSNDRHDGTVDRGAQKRKVMEMSALLLGGGALVSLVLAFAAQPAIDLLFGKGWGDTGPLLCILWFWAGSGLVNTPALAYLLAHEGNRDHLILETIQFVGRLATMAGGVFFLSGTDMLIPFVAWSATANLACSLWIVVKR
jgi:lipopolysaccharide exporter